MNSKKLLKVIIFCSLVLNVLSLATSVYAQGAYIMRLLTEREERERVLEGQCLERSRQRADFAQKKDLIITTLKTLTQYAIDRDPLCRIEERPCRHIDTHRADWYALCRTEGGTKQDAKIRRFVDVMMSHYLDVSDQTPKSVFPDRVNVGDLSQEDLSYIVGGTSLMNTALTQEDLVDRLNQILGASVQQAEQSLSTNIQDVIIATALWSLFCGITFYLSSYFVQSNHARPIQKIIPSATSSIAPAA